MPRTIPKTVGASSSKLRTADVDSKAMRATASKGIAGLSSAVRSEKTGKWVMVKTAAGRKIDRQG